MGREVRAFIILFFVVIFGSVLLNNAIKERSSKTIIIASDKEINESEEDRIPIEDEIQKEEIIHKDVLINEEVIDPLFDSSKSIVERIDNYLGEDKNNIGLIYYNLATDEQISFNENIDFEAASTYKVGLNIVCYDLVQKGSIALENQVYYYENQYQDGTGVLQFEPNLTSLPLQTILDYAIIYSDNIAATMAFDYIGGWTSYRQQLFNLLGIDYGFYENRTTANIEFKVLKYLYDNRDNNNYSHLIETMKNTEFDERLSRYLPKEQIAHKIGTYDWAIHDMGIVFTEQPYIIIMLTDGIYDADEKIANISKALYLYNSN